MVLPPEIWRKILYYAIVGEDGPNILDKCRSVCRDWNDMIKENVWISPNKEWGLITKAMMGCWVLPFTQDDFSCKGLGNQGRSPNRSTEDYGREI